MKTFWHIARIVLGLTFMFSGFVKGIDPLGSAYKFTDYFHAWGMEALIPFALPLGVLLSSAEFLIGIVLTTNVMTSLFATVSLLFMLFFTGLTLIIAISNPVTDCGCFGDALKLTNWQTFFKNIILLALAVYIFLYRKKFKPAGFSLVRIVFSGITFFAFAYLAGYSYNHLPIIDFLPYKAGTNINKAMRIPDGAPRDIYENTFIYRNRKTGEEKKFTEENYPWQDTLNWQFVSMDSKLVKKGYEPPIHNFIMETVQGEDVKDFFLHNPGYTFILVIYDQQTVQVPELENIRSLAEYAASNQMNLIGLTSASPEQTEQFKSGNKLDFDFFYGDETTLKTMIRSNPGLILIKNGIILDKWHYHDFLTVREVGHLKDFWDKRTN